MGRTWKAEPLGEAFAKPVGQGQAQLCRAGSPCPWLTFSKEERRELGFNSHLCPKALSQPWHQPRMCRALGKRCWVLPHGQERGRDAGT